MLIQVSMENRWGFCRRIFYRSEALIATQLHTCFNF